LLFAGLLLDFLADAEYPDPPNFFRRRKSAGEKCCCRKHRQIRKIGSAAAKTSANLQLNLPFLLSLKLHNSRAGFKRGMFVCEMVALEMFLKLTKLAQLHIFIWCSVC